MSVIPPGDTWEDEFGVIICGAIPTVCAYGNGGENLDELGIEPCKEKIAFYCDALFGEAALAAPCKLGVCAEHGTEVGWGRHRCWQHKEE